MNDGEQDIVLVPVWLARMHRCYGDGCPSWTWPVTVGAIAVLAIIVIGAVNRSEPAVETWFCLGRGEKIILPPGEIDAERWNQILREHADPGKCR